MPRRAHAPNSHVYRRHWVWRPDNELLIGSGDATGKVGNPKWNWHAHPSPHIRGERWRTMRMQAGGSGREATYKPMTVVKKEVKYSGVSEEDFLKLPEKSFLSLNSQSSRRNGYTRYDQTALSLPAANHATEKEYELQPVPRRHSTYTSHLTAPPRHYSRVSDGGVQAPDPNTFVPPRRDTDKTDYLKSLKDALNNQGEDGNAPSFSLKNI